jgi:hypothetical protein
MYSCECCLRLKNCITPFQNQNPALPNRVTFPWEEAMRGVYKHLAGVGGCSSGISRPRTWYWDGLHRICVSHTSCDSSRLYCCVYQCRLQRQRILLFSLFVCVDDRIQVKNKRHYGMRFVSLFLSSVWSRTTIVCYDGF